VTLNIANRAVGESLNINDRFISAVVDAILAGIELTNYINSISSSEVALSLPLLLAVFVSRADLPVSGSGWILPLSLVFERNDFLCVSVASILK